MSRLMLSHQFSTQLTDIKMCESDFIPPHFKFFDPQTPILDDSTQLFDFSSNHDSSTIRTTKEIPIFPFDFGVTFPTGEAPLNIFVMKYRQMMNDIQNKDKCFGIVLSNGENNGQFGEVGTMLYNEKQILLDDGRQLCFNKCLQRFRILEIVKTTPYMVAKVECNIQDLDVLEIKKSSNSSLLTASLHSLELEVWELLKTIVELTNRLVH